MLVLILILLLFEGKGEGSGKGKAGNAAMTGEPLLDPRPTICYPMPRQCVRNGRSDA